MPSTIIYLIGKPGVGKYSTAQEIAKSGYRICDNQLVNNPIFSLLNYGGFGTIPETAWDAIGNIRNCVFDFIASEADHNYVFTNVLNDDAGDRDLFLQVKGVAAKRASLFIPVTLTVSKEEHLKRVTDPARLLRFKSVDPKEVEDNTIPPLPITHPNLLTLDTTSLSPVEAARCIFRHVASVPQEAEREEKADIHPLRLALCSSAREWSTAKAYRQKYFFSKVPMDDPYLWTFDHEDHRHFALYEGADMVGYAHIQCWPEARAAIRIMVIEEEKRHRSFGKQFLERIEEWLRQQGYQSIHAESSPAAYPFYTKHGYVPMPFNDPGGDECGPPDIAVGKML